jgi:uncharacterized protein YbaR (Trm112 family)
MDLLAYPICKHFPLELYVFEEKSEVETRWGCEEHCGYERKPVRELKSLSCETRSKLEMAEGVLSCSSCERWYPIEEEIPEMLPDELRERNEEVKFLKKNMKVLFQKRP